MKSQLDILRQFVAAKDELELVAEFTDDGFSGTNYRRPQFEDMIEPETHVYEVEAVEEDGAVVIRFDGGDGERWYRTIDDFFAKAEIAGERIVTLYYDLYGFEVCDG